MRGTRNGAVQSLLAVLALCEHPGGVSVCVALLYELGVEHQEQGAAAPVQRAAVSGEFLFLRGRLRTQGKVWPQRLW